MVAEMHGIYMLWIQNYLLAHKQEGHRSNILAKEQYSNSLSRGSYTHSVSYFLVLM